MNGMQEGAGPGAWPLVRLTLPAEADDEAIGRLAQAAVDAGALGAAQEGETLAIYLPRGKGDSAEAHEALAAALASEEEAMGWEPLAPVAETLADAPWATAWKDRFRSFPFGKGLLIRPDWEKGTPPPGQWEGRKTIWLRPGQGFGTGHHETTRLALGTLEGVLQKGDAVLDFGTGSGILAFAAALLGAERVWGIDADPQALINARENLQINDLEGRVELLEADRPEIADRTFSLLVCNMLPQEALPLMEAIAGRLGGEKPRLIYTGFLADQIGEVQASLQRAGLRVVRSCADGEWRGVIAEPA